MEKEIKVIHIIPGRFLEKCEDKYLIKCYIDKNYTEDRLFDSFSLEGMKNPNLVFIGIMTGVGVIQANFCQADEFKKLFEKKWKILLK
jgi:hypothetical protein